MVVAKIIVVFPLNSKNYTYLSDILFLKLSNISAFLYLIKLKLFFFQVFFSPSLKLIYRLYGNHDEIFIFQI